jgi:hypothetical protein
VSDTDTTNVQDGYPSGELDQAALHGVLDRIQVHGLDLLALIRLEDNPG